MTSGDTTLMAESKDEWKSLLMKVKRESKKAGLKLNIWKIKIVKEPLGEGEKGEWKSWLKTQHLKN